MTRTGLLLCLLGLGPASVSGADVTLQGAHLCCGGCIVAAEEALTGLDGVSGASADTNSKTIVFQAADAKAALRGLEALGKAGFFGKVKHDGKPLAFPQAKIPAGKSDTVTLEGLHLCCTACVTGAQKCLQSVPGVKLIDIDRSKKTITLQGTDIAPAATLKALQAGGFQGRVQQKKQPK